MSTTLTKILGFSRDDDKQELIHQLQHQAAVETITLNREDTLRRRLRVISDAGHEYQIAISREEQLADGVVLLLEDDRAVVVRMAEESWLKVLPDTHADALELGYFAGNLHWRVKFDGPTLCIAVEGPESNYLNRLQPFLDSGQARRINPESE